MRKQLKLARISAELSQKELGDIVGVSQQTIAKWERGVSNPSHFRHMRAISGALGEPVELLFPDVFIQSSVI